MAVDVARVVDGGAMMQWVSHGTQVTEQVLSRLLMVTVADPTPRIRQTLIKELDARFDVLLCQPHHVQVRLSIPDS